MRRVARATRAAHAAALALLAAAPLKAQRAPSGLLPEPELRETPWGDFPLERVLPGARLRLTSADGRRVERRLLSLRADSLELRTPDGEPLPPISFAELREFRRIEVRAIPRWAGRAGTASLAGGVLLGAVAGAVIHNSRKPSSAVVHRPGRLEDIAAGALVGGLVGWEVGMWTLGRPRWRPVTLP